MSETAKDDSEQDRSSPEKPDPLRPSAAQWEQQLARTNDNLDTARALIKDAGNVVQWARALRKRNEQRRQTGQVQSTDPSAGSTPSASEPSGDAAAPLPSGLEAMPLFSGSTLLVIRLEQDLDLVTSPQLLRLLLNLSIEFRAARQSLDSPDQRDTPPRDTPPVVLDMRSVRFMDVSGVTILAQGRKALVGSGQRLMVMLEPGSQPERIFLLCNLTLIIPRIHSLDEL